MLRADVPTEERAEPRWEGGHQVKGLPVDEHAAEKEGVAAEAEIPPEVGVVLTPTLVTDLALRHGRDLRLLPPCRSVSTCQW